jgi:hypothetical protein
MRQTNFLSPMSFKFKSILTILYIVFASMKCYLLTWSTPDVGSQNEITKNGSPIKFENLGSKFIYDQISFGSDINPGQFWNVISGSAYPIITGYDSIVYKPGLLQQ